ncbi:HU family DNA-binding protein [Prevotella sp.]|uniref:HU family DNA-binding protein n=1 Tax=Prevotella sp. TaxID=59823 RepID=UPI003077E7F3
MAKVSDFASELVSRYGLKEEEATEFITAMFDIICEQLDAPDKQVKVKGLGTFKVTSVGARASVDVNTGERIIIEGRNKISFTPEVLLRDRVNRPFVQFETVVLNDGVDFSEIDREFDGDRKEPETKPMPEPEPVAEVGTNQETELVPDSETEQKIVTNQAPGPDAESEAQPEVGQVEPDAESEVQAEVEQVEPDAESEAQAEVEQVEPVPEAETKLIEEEQTEDTAQQEHQRVSTADSEDPDENAIPGSCEPKEAADVVLKERCKQRNPRMMYWFSIASFVLLLFIGAGMYFLYDQVKAKNAAIEQLQAKLAVYSTALMSQTADKQQEAAKSKMVEPTDTTNAATTTPAEAKVNAEAKPDVADKAVMAAKAEAAKSLKPSSEQPVVDKKKTNVPKPAPDYNFDARVRTGAYIIVGVETTVTVRSGQTLASISKAYLGPGMECYVEVFNNRNEVKPGDKLRIPKLKIKPRH